MGPVFRERLRDLEFKHSALDRDTDDIVVSTDSFDVLVALRRFLGPVRSYSGHVGSSRQGLSVTLWPVTTFHSLQSRSPKSRSLKEQIHSFLL